MNYAKPQGLIAVYNRRLAYNERPICFFSATTAICRYVVQFIATQGPQLSEIHLAQQWIQRRKYEEVSAKGTPWIATTLLKGQSKPQKTQRPSSQSKAEDRRKALQRGSVMEDINAASIPVSYYVRHVPNTKNEPWI